MPDPKADGLDTFLREGEAFEARHRERLPDSVRTSGAVVWGMLRALAECPACGPGVYRTPSDREWTELHCPRCGGTWVKEGTE